MFDSDIQGHVAVIMLSAAYTALNDPTTSEELALQIVDGAQAYINKMTGAEQIELRLRAIEQGLMRAPRFIVNEEPAITAVVEQNISLLIRRQYSARITRKIAHAIKLCTEASDKQYYFGHIHISRDAVIISMLPWSWGFMNWTWEFRKKPIPSAQRDYFMLATH